MWVPDNSDIYGNEKADELAIDLGQNLLLLN